MQQIRNAVRLELTTHMASSAMAKQKDGLHDKVCIKRCRLMCMFRRRYEASVIA